MTIFDSLKYPISNPPTAAELEALPNVIYYEWIESTSWYYSEYARSDRANVASWLRMIHKDIHQETSQYKESVLELQHLRKLIREYNDYL